MQSVSWLASSRISRSCASSSTLLMMSCLGVQSIPVQLPNDVVRRLSRALRPRKWSEKSHGTRGVGRYRHCTAQWLRRREVGIRKDARRDSTQAFRPVPHHSRPFWDRLPGFKTSGYWNLMDHFVFLIKSSQTLDALPDVDSTAYWTTGPFLTSSCRTARPTPFTISRTQSASRGSRSTPFWPTRYTSRT